MKKKTIRTNKKKLRKYSFGKPLAKTGYESADTVDTSLLSETPGYSGYKQAGEQIQSSILPSYITGMGSTMLSAGQNILNNTVTQNAANFANAGVANFVDAAGKLTAEGAKQLGDAALQGTTMTVSQAKQIADASAAAAKTAGKATSAGLNTAGTVASALQMAKGAYDMFGGFASYSDNLGVNDINATQSHGTNIRNGVAYDYIGGADQQGVMDYTNAQNSQSKSQVIQGSADIGSGVGTILGSTFGSAIIPGLGTIGGGLLGSVVGQGLGALTGWIGDSIFGGASRRKRRVQEALAKSSLIADAKNSQNESIAGTQGLRNEYYATHRAAEGKNPGERWSAGDYTGIQTPSGQTYGAVQGLAQPAEGEVDMLTGETHYNGSLDPNVEDSKKDIVPVGSANGDGEYFDMFVGIPGKQFADAARPYFKANEQIKISSQNIDKELQANADHKHRDEATKKYIQNRLEKKQQMLQQQYQQNSQYIQDLVRQQSAMTTGRKYSCGKTPRFQKGAVPDVSLDGIADFWKNYDDSELNIYPTYRNRSQVFNDVDDGIVPKSAIFDAPEDSPLFVGSKQPVSQKKPGLEYEQVRNNVGLPAWAGIAQALPYLIRTSNNAYGFQPHAENSYVANPYAGQAIQTLGNLGYDNSQDQRALTSAVRQQLHNINRAGNLSAGQKAALANNLQIKAAASRAALNQEMYNKNAAYKQATAQALLSSGEAQATRAQQALAAQQEAYRKAVGAKQHLMAQADKNWYTVGRQAIQDYNTQDMYGRMLDLYNMQMRAKGDFS